MKLYLMRHAEAADATVATPDALRPLTDKGLARTQAAARALLALEVDLRVVLTSPLRRAVQTAEIVAEAFRLPASEEEALARGPDLDDLQTMFEAHDMPAHMMVVGHEPDFSRLVGELIGGASVEMKKGAIACLEVLAFRRGGATLCWLMTARQLSLIR